MDCYLKLTRDLIKDGQENKILIFLECTRNGDAKVLQNTTYTTCKTHIEYGTEDQTEYNQMHHDAQCKHVVFNDRQNVSDMKTVPDSINIAPIIGLKE